MNSIRFKKKTMINLVDSRFGRLVVIKRVDNNKYGHLCWLCQCDCGQSSVIDGNSLKRGYTKSCGCIQKEKLINRSTKHGHRAKTTTSRIYAIWQAMIQRCTNPNTPSYKNYGSRGIEICKRWMEFENFLEDMGEPPSGLQLDRIDNDGDYCKSNCRWATSKQNSRNKRNNRLITFNGKTRCVSQWAEETGIHQKTIISRLKRGWSIAETLSD